MTYPQYDPIIVQSNQFGAPGRFRWQGKTYSIDIIERIWRSTQGKRSGQRVYRVRSRGKRFTLHFDQRLQRWSLVRAPWRTRLGLAVERLAARIAA
jgi:hypothetical protein